MKVHFREKYGSGGDEILYVTPEDQSCVVRVPLRKDVNQSSLFRENIPFVKGLKQIFLPQGYPDSVSTDYIEYQFWDTIQAFCSTITGTLATHAILKGVGVGNDAINALSATTTWVLKEGTGHFGRILFAWWKGTQLDMDSKKWRFRADLLNDIALGTEIFILPYFQSYSTFILCGTSTMKAIVGVAGGATRSALTQHHAIRGNLADVASKDSAQETCVNLIASFVGLFLLNAITGQSLLYTLFIIITCLHLYANYRAVKSVCLKTFNDARYKIALEEFFRSGGMLSPETVNQLERVTFGQTVSLSIKIRMGISAANLISEGRASQDIEKVVQAFETHERFIIAESKNYIGIYLHFDANALDILKSYFYAASYLQDRTQLKERYWEIENKWNEFLSLAQHEGWCSVSHLLNVDEYRINWKNQ